MLCDEQLWEKQMAYFSVKYHVVMGDVTQEDSIEKMATSLLEEAPEKFVLAGLSLGGIVSLEIVNQAPSRIENFCYLIQIHICLMITKFKIGIILKH